MNNSQLSYNEVKNLLSKAELKDMIIVGKKTPPSLLHSHVVIVMIMYSDKKV